VVQTRNHVYTINNRSIASERDQDQMGNGQPSKKIIGVFGGGNVMETAPEWQAAYAIGRLIAMHDCILLTGGLGGVMAAASQGAKEAGGTTIGILPGDRRTSRPNPYVDIAVYTGMEEARNVINVKSCHAAIAVGGEYGTLSEIALALKTGCPIVLLDSWSFSRRTGTGDNALRAANPEEAVMKAVAAAAG
jgi:uncharacterized protein (TIGR00725 family)